LLFSRFGIVVRLRDARDGDFSPAKEPGGIELEKLYVPAGSHAPASLRRREGAIELEKLYVPAGERKTGLGSRHRRVLLP
jgi:hypothetical protein